MSKFKIDGLKEFLQKCQTLGGPEVEDEMKVWVEAGGMELLDIVQDEIIRLEVVAFRKLLNSFTKGDADNIWTIHEGGLSLDIGSNLEYAKLVNDGHRLVGDKFSFRMKDGRKARWVPGEWRGDGNFYYVSGSKNGMLITEKYIDGRPYWDNALKIFEKIFQRSFEVRMKDWISRI